MRTHQAVCAVLTCLILVMVLIPSARPAGKTTAEEIAAWAKLPADGPQGRPLPLTGSWNTEDWGAPYLVKMIERGHHVLPTFVDPNFIAAGAYLKGWRGAKDKVQKRMDDYYRPALEYCRKHNLPIVFRGWNWGDRVGMYEDAIAGEKRPPEQSARVIKEGKKARPMDPFGPIERWREWGSFWFGNEMVRRFQEIYPDPPMVVWLNNNEGPKVRNPDQLPADYPRMVEIHGRSLEDRTARARAIREGYEKRYAALFEAARGALVEDSWKNNVKFVAYNNLWGTGYIGSGNRPQPGLWFDREAGWLNWRMYDGGMPELYDNDWQPGKTDYRPHSPQAEAMNYFSVQKRIFQRDANFYWSTITWDGGRVGQVWRGRRSSSKTYRYVSRGQRWDFARYEGWVQFCLWAARPRTMREFRGGATRGAYFNGTWMGLVRSVDRPWNNEVLREFWRFGTLVPNPDEDHPWTLSQDQPEWVRDLKRWHLLTCDANPPREWAADARLRVFSLALKLGEKPERRWLVYAHAPLGAVAGATVKLPGYGNVVLDSVPRSGSFFLVSEAAQSVEDLITGGPAEIALRADASRVDPGQTVRFQAEVTHPADHGFTSFTWSINGEDVVRGKAGDELKHTFEEEGEYLVTVRADPGEGDDDETLTEQTAVFVGESPSETVLYDLSLDAPFAWKGPWGQTGENAEELVPYRHLPNGGTLPPAVLSGGRFVDDPQRGPVLELAEKHDGVWFARSKRTVMDLEGQANRTVSLWFKPATTEGRQVIYAEGFDAVGMNIYLAGDVLYAGAWAPIDGKQFDWHPVYGRNWDGDWLHHEGIEPGRWYHVALQFKNATDEVQPEKMHLWINGERVASGPGARLPRRQGVPRIGQPMFHWNGRLLSRFHDKEKKAEIFRGRIDDFRLINAAVTPTVPATLAAPEPGIDAYFRWMLDNIDEIEKNIPEIADTAEAAAVKYATGDWNIAGGGDYGVLTEACGRAGGIMALKWGYPPRYLKVGPENKCVMLFALREDHYEEYLKNTKKHLAGEHAFLVVMGPSDLVKRAEEDGMPMDASFVVPTAENDGLFRGEDDKWLVPTTPTASMAALWAWTSEFVAACTRHGKMPVMHQSYAVPGAKERAEKLKDQKFYPKKATPVPEGKLARQFLRKLRADVREFYQNEKDKLARAVNMAWDARQNGNELYAFVHGHSIVMQQVNYPHSPGHLTQINKNWFEQKDKITLQPGDFVFCLGYDHRFNGGRYGKWDEEAREAGATLVWCLADYKEEEIAPIKQAGELFINQHWDYGDAVVEVPGFPLRICPTSGHIAQGILRMFSAGLLAREKEEQTEN